MAEKIKIITHSGTFHADEVFACATLAIIFEKQGKEFEIIRTRDMEIIKTGDVVVDVGGIYDPENNKFDHHQPDGAGTREAGAKIPYASFGLVWKKFGEEAADSKEIAEKIESKIAVPIDAVDSGIPIMNSKFEDVFDYDIGRIVDCFVPSWNEINVKTDDMFLEAMGLARKILEREIVRAKGKLEAKKKVIEGYENAEDKRVVEFKNYYPWKEFLKPYPEPLFVVTPREEGKWQAEAVFDGDPYFMKRKKYFPEAWAGLRDDEMAKVTGVADAVFCHTHRFLIVAKSREGILALVKMALES